MVSVNDGYIIDCSRCGGIGTIHSETHGAVDCPICFGQGRVLSSTGLAVVKAVQLALDTGELKVLEPKSDDMAWYEMIQAMKARG